jgi:hypothetical protein
MRPRARQWRHDDTVRQMERAKPVWLEQRVRIACLNGTECPLGRGDLVHVFSLQGPEPSVFRFIKSQAICCN